MNSAIAARLETQCDQTTLAPARFAGLSPVLCGICALLFFAVLSFGAVEEWSISALEIAFPLLFLTWVGSQVASGGLNIRSSPLYAPVTLFGILVLAQFVFNTSAYRYATLLAGSEYLVYGIVLFLTIHNVVNEGSTKTAIWSLTVFGFTLAVFAIVQDLTSNGKIYWCRTLHNGGSLFGPYVNHDHYAGLMEMLCPIPIVVSLSSLLQGGKRALVGFAGVLMAGTIVLCQSRAGTASFLAEMALLLALVLRKRRGRVAATLGTVCLMVTAFVVWAGTAALWHHFTELQGDMRLAMTKDGLRMFWHKPILGWGLGTFTTVYPQFQSFYTNLFVNAAHNDYVQVLVETGLVGFAAVVWFILAVYRLGLRNADGWNRNWPQALGLAALVGCTGLLVHSAFDFNLQIPANACFFYFLCAVTTSTAKLPKMSARSISERGNFGPQCRVEM